MSRFIIYEPTKEDVAEAFRRSQQLGVLDNSFTRGRGRMTGFLGEVAFGNTFPEAVYVGDRSFTHDYELTGYNIDVKAKTCSGRPLIHYSASVAKSKNQELKADIYFFMRVHQDLSKVWFCGWSTAKGVGKNKYYKKRGEADEYGFTYMSNGYHLPIRSTRRPDSLESQCRKKKRG